MIAAARCSNASYLSVSFISYQELSKPIEPGVCYFNDPPSGFEIRISLFLLDFFSALLNVRNIMSIFNNLLSRFTGISFISAQMLVGLGAFNYNPIKDSNQLSDIIPICSCYDYREWYPNLVH